MRAFQGRFRTPLIMAAAAVFALAAPAWSQNASAQTSSATQAQAEGLARALTNQMISAMQALERATPEARPQLLQQLQQIVARRQAILQSIVEKNPDAVMLQALPGDLRQKLPADVAAMVEQEVDATGKMVGRVSDDFVNRQARHEFLLEVPVNGKTKLLNVRATKTGPDEAQLDRLIGSKVRMRGMLLKDDLVVGDRKKVELLAAGGSTTTSTSGSGTLAAAAVNETLLVIIGNFTDASVGCSATDLTNRLFGTTGATLNTVYQETSRQQVSFSGQVIGPFNIPYSSGGSCDYSGWASALDAAAQAAGVNPSSYRRISYAIPPNGSCGWSGLGYVGGSLPTRSWVNTCSNTGVFVHEVGHNLGFRHASTPSSEYGDYSDPMGGAPMVDFNGANRTTKGWAPSGTVVDGTSSGSYALTSLSLTGSLMPQVLRVPKKDTGEYYYVSLRTGVGFDANLSGSYKNVVSIHQGSGVMGAKTILLGPYAAGQSFVDSVNGVTITPQSISGDGATISVAMTTAPCTTASPSVTMSPSSQSGAPGTTRQYSMTVQNMNGSTCASTTFSLGQSLPSGFTGSFSPASMTLAPGASGTVTWSVTSPGAAAGGTYALGASAQQSASTGSTGSASASYVVFQDVTAPVVSITSPSNGAVLTSGKVTFKASASDSNGVARVEYYATSSATGATQLVGTATNAPYSVNWNTRRVARGAYTITARAYDTAGLSSDASIALTFISRGPAARPTPRAGTPPAASRFSGCTAGTAGRRGRAQARACARCGPGSGAPRRARLHQVRRFVNAEP